MNFVKEFFESRKNGKEVGSLIVEFQKEAKVARDKYNALKGEEGGNNLPSFEEWDINAGCRDNELLEKIRKIYGVTE